MSIVSARKTIQASNTLLQIKVLVMFGFGRPGLFPFIGSEEKKNIRCTGENRKVHNLQGSSLRSPCRIKWFTPIFCSKVFCFN